MVHDQIVLGKTRSGIVAGTEIPSIFTRIQILLFNIKRQMHEILRSGKITVLGPQVG